MIPLTFMTYGNIIFKTSVMFDPICMQKLVNYETNMTKL
jgi:hypothetical protein